MAETALTETTDTQTPEHEVILTETAARRSPASWPRRARRPAPARGRPARRLLRTGLPALLRRASPGRRRRARLPTGSDEMTSVEVVVDRMSVPYLSGATIDFADTIEKQGFTIDNPNAAGSCACGESFH